MKSNPTSLTGLAILGHLCQVVKQGVYGLESKAHNTFGTKIMWFISLAYKLLIMYTFSKVQWQWLSLFHCFTLISLVQCDNGANKRVDLLIKIFFFNLLLQLISQKGRQIRTNRVTNATEQYVVKSDVSTQVFTNSRKKKKVWHLWRLTYWPIDAII